MFHTEGESRYPVLGKHRQSLLCQRPIASTSAHALIVPPATHGVGGVLVQSSIRTLTKPMRGPSRTAVLQVTVCAGIGAYMRTGIRSIRSSEDRNSENILALGAPTTTRCDFCQVSFCGINVPQRCIAAPLHVQHPDGFADLSDLIQSRDVYSCFEENTVEVDIMLDYLNAQRLTPRHIYREVCVCPLVPLQILVNPSNCRSLRIYRANLGNLDL